MRARLLALLVLAASAACKPRPSPGAADAAPAPKPTATHPPDAGKLAAALPPDAARLAAASNALGYDLYRDLPAGNAALSPVSVELALAMTACGARGATRQEMEKVLHLDGAAPESWGPIGAGLIDHGAELRLANRLFVEKTYPLDAPFRALTERAFGAAAEPVDYAGDPEGARARVNGWVEERTNHRIRGLLPSGSVDRHTRLTVVNAVEMTATWETAFAVAATSPGPFHLDATHDTTAPLMHRMGDLASGAVDGAHVVSLPYQGGVLAMTVLVPDAVDGLPALEARLSRETIARFDAALATQSTSVTLPRFTIAPSDAIDLRRGLQRLGMPSAFDGARADFTGIAGRNADPPLVVGGVLHEAFVKVDERGTEAAAATAVVVAAPPEATAMPLAVTADRPFLFLVREVKTGMVLFLGRVTKPA